MDLASSILHDVIDTAVHDVELKWQTPDQSDQSDEEFVECNFQNAPEIDFSSLPPMSDKEVYKDYIDSFKVLQQIEPNYEVEAIHYKLKWNDELATIFNIFLSNHTVTDEMFQDPIAMRRSRGYDGRPANTFFKKSDFRGSYLIRITVKDCKVKELYTCSTLLETATCSIKRGEGHSIRRSFSQAVFCPWHYRTFGTSGWPN